MSTSFENFNDIQGPVGHCRYHVHVKYSSSTWWNVLSFWNFKNCNVAQINPLDLSKTVQT